ncbi:class I SAM-dependent methyltransferase, partial [candidate division KSB1 bacterium]
MLGIDVFVGDLIDTKYQSYYFDLVMMWHVLEHIENPVLYLKEISRILKENGKLIIEVPNLDSLNFRIFKEKW